MFARLASSLTGGTGGGGDEGGNGSSRVGSGLDTLTPPSTPPRLARSSAPSSPSSRGSPRKNREWVPLFVSPSAGSGPNSPLSTTTVLPPSPRRTTYGDLMERDRSPNRLGSSDPRRRNDGVDVHPLIRQTKVGPEGEGAASSATQASPSLEGQEPNATTSLQQRRATTTAQEQGSGAGGGTHLRKRSSSANLRNEGIDEPAPRMDRLPSLTTLMSGPTTMTTTTRPGKLTKRHAASRSGKGVSEKDKAGGWSSSGIRPYRTLIRLCILGVAITISLSLLRLIVRLIFGLASPSEPSDFEFDDPSGSSWLSSIPRPKSLYDRLETVPYPVKTHPRTPKDDEYRRTTFAEYLSTRLGSHFSYPTTPRRTRPSQLWLTTATSTSVRITAPHLHGFVRDLDQAGDEATIWDLDTDEADTFARRTLVTLCRDQGCIDYCRRHDEMFCWGGMIPEGRDERKVKLRAIVETLESGRRVFVVDSDVFFKTDPIPFMGALSDYDMQITDTWKTGAMQTGFLFLNPTRTVISLFRRLLELSRGPDTEDHIWRTTNLLLDPTGTHRDHAHVAPPHAPGEDENLFAESTRGGDDAVENLYGQIEFESPWDGGIDVRVLDRKRFRTSTGRLARMDWERERNNLAVYFHCVCCGDLASESYMAGSLGYHTPSVVYPFLEADLRAQIKPGRRPKTQAALENGGAIPSFPRVLRLPTLVGNATTLQFVIGMMLQAAHDSGRTFVPPLKGTLLKETQGSGGEEVVEIERYIWRLFPTSDWASHGSVPGGEVAVAEPNYVVHAIEYLRSTASETERGLSAIAELSDVLWLDLKSMRSYEEMIRVLTRPYFSTTRIVNVELVEEVVGKEHWDLRDEFVGLDMCEIDESHEGHGGEEGTCETICPIMRRRGQDE